MQNQTSFAPIESIFTQSESFPIAYIVHYVPFTVQEILHCEQVTDLSHASASIYSVGGGDFAF